MTDGVPPQPRLTSRRVYLLAAAGGVATLACGGGPREPSQESEDSAATAMAPALSRDGEPADGPAEVTPAIAGATPTATVRPAGRETRTLLPDTPAATSLVIRHSGIPGPTAIVLGGVHGNEPGGWGATDYVAENWEPVAGSLIVLPRANVLAIASFVRTFDDIGDLNRLYPGNPDSPLLMEQMAASIIAVCKEFNVDLLIDMHESWGFYRDYPGTGTSALGQTVTAGVGPRSPDLAITIRDRLNPNLPERDQLIVREGRPFSGNQTPGAGGTNRGRSSLGIGAHVPDLTPILVEMGQENQDVDRRISLHLLVGRAMLEVAGVL